MKAKRNLIPMWLLVAVLLTLPAALQAQLLDVNFIDDSVNAAYGGGNAPAPSAMSGAAVIGSAGDIWNGLHGFTYSANPNGATFTSGPLVYANGSASGVTVSLSAPSGTYDANAPGFNDHSPFSWASLVDEQDDIGYPYTSWAALMASCLTANSTTANGNVMLSGLTPNGVYNLYIYNASDQNEGTGRTSTFTVNGVTQTSTYAYQTNLVQGADYLEFTNVVANENGTLTINFGDLINSESDFNGFQLQTVTNQVQFLTNLVVATSSTTPQCGSNVTFTASVNGLPPITYQWYDNNTNAIPGATNASYTLVDPTDGSVGTYTLVAQNAHNSLTNSTTITSVLHTALPVMALNGINPVNVVLNTPYVDAGATAFDLCAQASLTVTSNNPVNTSVGGTYTVTYSATTADGTPGTITRTVIVSATPNFGPNVFIYNSSTPTATIQNQLNTIFNQQNNVNSSQFDTNRYAILFEPGTYNLTINMGYYMQVLGLGQSPDNVTINGELQCYNFGGQSTENFWLSAENLAVIPTNNSTMTWSVSQDCPLRRLHVRGNLNLSDGTYSSGGFLADSKVDSTVSSISQQQWLSRNDIWGSWSGSVWNMVFVGVSNAPSGTWPSPPYTVITNTPYIAEKPYLYVDSNINFYVMVPSLETNYQGTSWASGPTPGVSIPISQFYIAQPGTDNAGSINAALNSGLNLILTPGIYHLTNSILVTNPDTIVLGLGFPTLVPTNGNPAMVISDVNGVKVSGILFDAGTTASPSLLEVGTATSSVDHSADPIGLYDICCRVGGEFVGTTTNCVTINANNVIGDDFWLWRADHSVTGNGWTVNPSQSGLVVNGNNVTIYGLANEHHEQYQTLWNGNWGRVYFYQSELPYDAPNQSSWTHNGVNGYASYEVASSVTSHQAYGLGIYGVFNTSNVKCFNTIETPTNQQVNVHDMINVLITAQTGSEMTHIINGTGATLNSAVTTAKANYLWKNPTFSVSAGLDITGTNIAITLPTESWHTYQLQYKNNVTDPSWSNLGGLFGGNDVQETITDSTLLTNRFYRVGTF